MIVSKYIFLIILIFFLIILLPKPESVTLEIIAIKNVITLDSNNNGTYINGDFKINLFQYGQYILKKQNLLSWKIICTHFKYNRHPRVSTYANDEEASTTTYSTASVIYQILAGETESMSQERLINIYCTRRITRIITSKWN